jgi:beta-lactamase superfamily II metal-dependent hydrolase
MFTIEMLHANEGDALWIEYGEDGGEIHRVLVDCGRASAYKRVRDRLKAADEAGEELRLDLFILTHVDEDHIFGAVKLLQDDRFPATRVDDVWFNGWGHLNGERVPPIDVLGAQQGEYFAALLRDGGFNWNAEFDHFPVVVPAGGPLPTATLAGGMKLTLLSPTKTRLNAMKEEWKTQLNEKTGSDRIEPGDAEHALEVLEGESRLQADQLGTNWVPEWNPDDVDVYAGADFDEDVRPPNGSSIAVLAEFDGKAALLCGDAFPSVIRSSLNRLKEERSIVGRFPLDAVKVPHHGSENNLDPELVSAVRCKKWLFSTNGAKHYHPHPSAVARVVDGVQQPTLYFNFKSEESEVWDSDPLRDEHSYETEYGTGGMLQIEL